MILATRWDGSVTGVGRRALGFVALLGAVLIGIALIGGCAGEPHAVGDEAEPTRAAGSRPFTLGDVEAAEPLRRIRWIQPLADHLAGELAGHGVDHGRVVVARGLDEMARLLREGEVDLYMDSPLAVLDVAQAAGARILLRRWVGDQPEYRGLFLTHRDSGLEGPDDLDGRTIAFQERHSTTGFLLPAFVLVERGHELREVSEPTSTLPPGRVGIFLTGDEENSIQLLLANAVAAAVVSNQDYEGLPDGPRASLVVLDATPSVPRQLVAARPGLEPALLDAVHAVLVGLTDEDRDRLSQQVDGEGWTWRFDELPAVSLARLEDYSARLAELALD